MFLGAFPTILLPLMANMIFGSGPVDADDSLSTGHEPDRGFECAAVNLTSKKES